MTPTKEQYQKAAAFCGYAVVRWIDGRPYAVIGTAVGLWQPLTPQDGLPLLAKVEKWIWDSDWENREFALDIDIPVHLYHRARASGNEQAWLEAGFLLAAAIQEAGDVC